LWGLPCPAAQRSEGASALRHGKVHAREAQGTGTRSIGHTHRKPLALTKWAWLERTLCPGKYSWPRSSLPGVSPAFRPGLCDQRFDVGQERPYEQPQKHPARLPARPWGAVEHAMVALEAPRASQAHGSQGGAHTPFARCQDRAASSTWTCAHPSKGRSSACAYTGYHRSYGTRDDGRYRADGTSSLHRGVDEARRELAAGCPQGQHRAAMKWFLSLPLFTRLPRRRYSRKYATDSLMFSSPTAANMGRDRPYPRGG
jgi:hypothetical protein